MRGNLFRLGELRSVTLKGIIFTRFRIASHRLTHSTPAQSSTVLPQTPILEVRGLDKCYGAIPVLQDISLSFAPGEIVGLIGENGAGKSTFAKCITGITPATAGEFAFAGTAMPFPDISTAQKLGIITLPQEFNLINGLTVAENIFLGRELGKFGFVNHREMNRQATELLGQLECNISPEMPVAELSVANRQFVEIAKALSQQCRFMILDEPTTVLNRDEVVRLFKVMRQLRDRGTTLLFVSHKLRELLEICSRIVILRDGQVVSDTPASALDEQEMARRMVGRELNSLYPPKHTPAPEAPVILKASGITSGSAVREVSFDLRAGEILGFSGLVGSGRTELAECIAGLRKIDQGTLTFADAERRFKSPRDAVKCGIAYLSEDRQGAGILGGFSIAANTTLTSLKNYCFGGWISTTQENQAADKYIHRFHIKAPNAHTLLNQLSGGNQQKVAIAKGLDTAPRLFIFDEPTRGIDVSARSEIYAFIKQLLEQGIACILISSDLDEVRGMCNRIAVMHEGRLAGILTGEQCTEEEIMYLSTGIKEKSIERHE